MNEENNNQQENNNKPSLSAEQKIFISKLLLFIVFGAILPFTFIAWRYDIFKASKMSLTGWGFISIIIIAFFVIYCVKTLRKCFPHTMFAQCVNGFMAVLLPLTILLFIVNGIETNIDAFKQALIVTIVCEAVAIVVNPIPKFVYEHNLEREDNKLQKLVEILKDDKKKK